jgi:predicted nucleic acid-binding protein
MNHFLALPRVGYREETFEVAALWHPLAASSKTSPKLWMDAYLAAFALAGGYQLVTTDKAFKQFKGLDLFVFSSKS